MQIIQLKTANRGTEPSDYWDEEMFVTSEFENTVMDKTHEAALTVGNVNVETVMAEADHQRFIVDHDADEMWDHPRASISVEVYDGYVE